MSEQRKNAGGLTEQRMRNFTQNTCKHVSYVDDSVTVFATFEGCNVSHRMVKRWLFKATHLHLKKE